MPKTVNRYFDWLTRNLKKGGSYFQLFKTLYDIDFTPDYTFDENRESDGIYLRYDFCCDIHQSNVDFLGDKPCSVLELIVSVARTCESFMERPGYGDQTGKWFWIMMDNLHLSGMDDEHFDEDYVRERIDILINREYQYNGDGGLFIVDDPPCAMYDVQIWDQMNWYLSEMMY